MKPKHDLSWAAGFFEGEGYVGFVKSKGYKKRKYPKLIVSVSQVSKEPLDAFAQAVGFGSVRGPYGPYGTTKQAYYQYQTSGPSALSVIQCLRPWLFAKGEQADLAIRAYLENNFVET